MTQISAKIKKTEGNRINQCDIFHDIDIVECITEGADGVSVSYIRFPLMICLNQDCDLNSDERDKLKENSNKQKVILQLHGGGYIGAMRNAYRMFAGLYNEVSKGMSVLTIDYRVAPENPYPAALEDAVSAYQWLLDQGWFAEDIIVAGDSAGGGLAMALCHYLKDYGIQLPCGIVAMSPWTDLMASGESYDTNYERDPLFGNTRDSLIYNKDYVGDHDPMDAYISPLYGDFRGFPPMLIQVGSYEMLLSDSVSVASKARHQGVKVRLSIYDGMFHIFQMAAKMLPESRKAWAEIGKFIDVLSND